MGDSASYMRTLAEDFVEFFAHRGGLVNCGLPFSHALEEWVTEGDAIELTGGNFEVFLQAVIYMMMRAAVQRTDAISDFNTGPFIEIEIDFDFGEGVPPDILDRRLWQAKVFKRRA